jgi:ATP-dependent protease ClpP protease subunit
MNAGSGSGSATWGAQDAMPTMPTGSTLALSIARDGRFVYFDADVTHASSFELMKHLRAAEAEVLSSVKLAEANMAVIVIDKCKHAKAVIEPHPIVLVLTTYGGTVSAAFAVVDLIEALKVPVHTVISGYVASAGTLISLAGARRFMGRHAQAMLHEVRGGYSGKMSQMRDGFYNTENVMKQVVEYYQHRISLTADQLEALLKHDKNWSPQECLDNGFIHEIGLPPS